ncbi:hypothetical protein KA531_00990, partial [Candidatus Saccharibacteria bacterium]|nr:hypothetical protein [Candidatus Saccharibacteria bacterium]
MREYSKVVSHKISKILLPLVAVVFVIILGLGFLQTKKLEIVFESDQGYIDGDRPLDARLLAYANEDRTELIGYVDYQGLNISEQGRVRLDVPESLIGKQEVGFFQVCVNGQSDLALEKLSSQGITDCDNAILSEHHYNLTSCSMATVPFREWSIIDRILDNDQRVVFLSGSCTSYGGDASKLAVNTPSSALKIAEQTNTSQLIQEQDNSQTSNDVGLGYIANPAVLQRLILSNQTLSIEGANSVDLSEFLDNTDLLSQYQCQEYQTLTYLGNQWQCQDPGAYQSVATLEILGSIVTYTNSLGQTISFDISEMESLTTITDNNNGTFSYTDEAGNTTIIDISNLETLTTISANPANQTITYTDEAGDQTTVNIKDLETTTNLTVNIANQSLSYTNEDGSTTTVDIKSLETTTNLTNTIANGQVIGTYTNEDGVSVDIKESVTTLVNNNDGTYSYTSEDGSVSVITDTLGTLNCTTDQLAIWNSSFWVCENISNLETTTEITSTLSSGNLIGRYTNEDGAITNIYETTTTITDNNNGTFSYTDEAGNTTIIDISNLETLTTISANPANQTITYTDEAGDQTTVNIKDLETTTNLTVNIANQSLSYTNEDGSTTTVDIKSLETTTNLTNTIANGQVIGTYTNEDGVSVDIKESVTTLVNNNDGTYSYTSEDGSVSVITDTLGTLNCTTDQLAIWNSSFWVCENISNLETTTEITSTLSSGNLIGRYTNEDGAITNIYETTTTITDNNNGTFSYTDEAGNTTIIDISNLETLTTISANPANQTITYTDEAGDQTTVNIKDLETTTNLTVNIANQSLSYTNEDGSTTTVDIKSLETTTNLTNTIANG